jgi:hypothetical protein
MPNKYSVPNFLSDAGVLGGEILLPIRVTVNVIKGFAIRIPNRCA